MSQHGEPAEIAELICRLDLQPHPEGGYFRELFRSSQPVFSSRVQADRAAMTHIYFLLATGQHSRFHQVAHEELWHFYAGDPLHLLLFDGQQLHSHRLDGERNHCLLVPAGYFQAAETTGRYSLVGCTVAPGFDFADFHFLADQPGSAARLRQLTDDGERFL